MLFPFLSVLQGAHTSLCQGNILVIYSWHSRFHRGDFIEIYEGLKHYLRKISLRLDKGVVRRVRITPFKPPEIKCT